MHTISFPENKDETATRRIIELLQDLPPASLMVAEQFVRFLYVQAHQGQFTASGAQTVYACPNVVLPTSSLERWVNLVPLGYTGDALEDSEALYA